MARRRAPEVAGAFATGRAPDALAAPSARAPSRGRSPRWSSGCSLEPRARRQQCRQRLLRVEERSSGSGRSRASAGARRLTHHIRRARRQSGCRRGEDGGREMRAAVRPPASRATARARASCTAIGFTSTPNRQRCATQPPEAGALRSRRHRLADGTFDDQRALEARGDEATGRDEERAAAHRGIQHAQRQDALRRSRPWTSGAERDAHQVVGQRARACRSVPVALAIASTRAPGVATGGRRAVARRPSRVARRRGPRRRCADGVPRPHVKTQRLERRRRRRGRPSAR